MIPVVARTICALLMPAALFAQASRPGQLDASYPLFTVLAAINAGGYDADLNSPSNHPLRAQIRKAIAEKNPPSLAELKQFYEANKTESPQRDLAQYVSFAMSLQDPPSFKFRFSRQELPPDAKKLEGLAPILERFYKEAGIEGLWKQSQPAFQQMLERYQPGVIEAVEQANLYLRNPTSGVSQRRFQIWVDALAAPNQALRWTNVDDYVILVTASQQPRIEDIRRAYLHYLVDPLMLRNALKLEKKRPIQDLTNASPILDEIYKTDFTLLAGMCLVRAVEARLAPLSQRQAMVDRAMSEGFILTAYFFEGLPAYEKDGRAMRLYAGDLIDGIDLAKEDARIAKVQFASKRESRTVRVAPPPPPEPTGVLKDIDTAERHYEQRDLEKAKEAYRQVLTGEAPRPVHARAYYGLARIAILEKNPELAEKLFEKALELDPEPAVKAWLHVYLARLARAAQEPERAVEQYKAALAVEGATEMAKASARKELDAVTSRKEP